MVGISLPKPSIIFGAGGAGIGKTTVFRDILPDVPDIFLLEKDAQLEAFLWSNPFLRRTPKLELPENTRLSFSSDTYKSTLRDQVYASVFEQAYRNTLLGKSTVVDANYIGWLKEPRGRISLALSMTHFFEGHLGLRYAPSLEMSVTPTLDDPYERFRMPILFFYVTDPGVVRQRLIRRAEQDPMAKDRDWSKISTPEAWETQVSKELVTWFPALDLYADLVVVDVTQEYAGAQRERVREQIIEFLRRPLSLRATGIFKGEDLDDTLRQFRAP